MRKIKPGSPTYFRRKVEVLQRFAPSIYPCQKCGNPVATGYLCSFCNADNSENPLRPHR